jgi:hypothetical protein
MNAEAYKKGQEALKAKDYKGAVRDFETVLKDMNDRHDQYNNVVSCLGLSQVLTSNRNGLLLCRDAASSENLDANVFLNLACSEWYCKNRKRSIDALRHGLKVDAENEQLKRALVLLDMRKKNLFGFLPRGHPLNRMLGRLLRRTGDELTIDRLLY